MEKLRLDLEQLNRALETLEQSFRVAQEIEKIGNWEFVLAAEDSTIQRFEYTYETFWKFFKKYLEQVHYLKDINSPKKTFLACVNAGVCTLNEGSIFIDMADGRNETSHVYNIEASRVVLADIPEYYSTMFAVVKRVNTLLD